MSLRPKTSFPGFLKVSPGLTFDIMSPQKRRQLQSWTQPGLIFAGAGSGGRDPEGRGSGEPLSQRVHVVHVVGSVVNLLQEVFQLLDENALLEPLDWTEDNSKCWLRRDVKLVFVGVTTVLKGPDYINVSTPCHIIT